MKTTQIHSDGTETRVPLDPIYASYIAQIEAERNTLRAALSKVAENIGNGSVASPDASVEFLCSIPEEVRLYTNELRATIERLEKDAHFYKNVNPHGGMSD